MEKRVNITWLGALLGLLPFFLGGFGIVKQTAHPPWSYSGDEGETIYAAESFLQPRQIAFIGSITAQTVVIYMFRSRERSDTAPLTASCVSRANDK